MATKQNKSLANMSEDEKRQIAQAILKGDKTVLENPQFVRTFKGKHYAAMALVASMVGLHYTTVRNYTLQGVFPSQKMSRKFYLDYAAAIKTVESGKLADLPASAANHA